MNKKKNIQSWILALRPKTLTAAVVPILVGTALASALHQSIQPWMAFFALMSTIFIQIGTNLVNDAADFKKGADTAERIGPRRVTQSGLLSSAQVQKGAFFCFFLAVLMGLPLVIEGGWPIILIGIFSLIAGYCYTGGPYPLAYLGLGDLFVLIFFGWVAVGGMYYLNTGQLELQVAVAATQVGLLATVLIAINNFRDIKTDRKAAKKTLPVRWGAAFARIEVANLCFIPFFLGAYWFGEGLRWAFLLPLILLPLAFKIVKQVLINPPSPLYNSYLGQAAALHLGYGVLLSLGLWMGK